MTFPPAHNPESVDDYLALLPAGLRAFVEREVLAGNAIVETGTGFPAAPVGVWLKLSKGFETMGAPLPEGVVHRRRPDWMWPAECTDAPQHFFILSGTEPPAPPPEVICEPPVGTFSGNDKIDQWAMDVRVSDAIAEHLGLMWNAEMEKAIVDRVGVEGLARVKAIDAYADRMEFWTEARDNMRAYEQMKKDLADKFPFLSRAAIERLATRGAWSWR